MINKLLNKLFLNKCISYSKYNDNWCLRIEDYYLVCKNIIFDEEELIYELLRKQDMGDKNSLKSSFLSENMHKKIISIEMDDANQLKLRFHEGLNLLISSDNTGESFQWAVNKTGEPPEKCKNIMICFLKQKIEIDNDLLEAV